MFLELEKEEKSGWHFNNPNQMRVLDAYYAFIYCYLDLSCSQPFPSTFSQELRIGMLQICFKIFFRICYRYTIAVHCPLIKRSCSSTRRPPSAQNFLSSAQWSVDDAGPIQRAEKATGHA